MTFRFVFTRESYYLKFTKSTKSFAVLQGGVVLTSKGVLKHMNHSYQGNKIWQE